MGGSPLFIIALKPSPLLILCYELCEWRAGRQLKHKTLLLLLGLVITLGFLVIPRIFAGGAPRIQSPRFTMPRDTPKSAEEFWKTILKKETKQRSRKGRVFKAAGRSLMSSTVTPRHLPPIFNYKQSNCKDLNGHLNYCIKV